MKAAERLAQQGIQARVLSVPTLKPLDTEAVLVAARGTSAIVTIEEHSVIGGLGSAVSETLAEAGIEEIRLCSPGMPDCFGDIGSQECSRRSCRLRPQGISSAVQDMLGRS